MTATLEGGEWSAACPGRTLPPGKTRHPLQETGWAPGPVWTGGKISSLPGFNPQTVQPVAQSLYRLSYRVHTNKEYKQQKTKIRVCKQQATASIRLPEPVTFGILLQTQNLASTVPKRTSKFNFPSPLQKYEGNMVHFVGQVA